MTGFTVRPRTKVYVERQSSGWFGVLVQYPDDPTPRAVLMSAPTKQEAVRVAHGYALKHGWLFVSDGEA